MNSLAKFFNYNFEEGPLSLYDTNKNRLYYEDSDGFRFKQEFDKNNNVTYYEDSYEYWYKREFDENQNGIYYEDSSGYITDNRPEYAVSVIIEGEMIVKAKSFKNAKEKVGKELEEINSLRPLILRVSDDMDCLEDNIDFPNE